MKLVNANKTAKAQMVAKAGVLVAVAALALCMLSGCGDTEPVDVTVHAEKWDAETSTPPIVLAISDDDLVEACRTVTVDEMVTIDLLKDHYTIEIVPPVNADGSIYIAPDPENLVVTKGERREVVFDLEYVPADKVTAKMLLPYIDSAKYAVELGDTTMGEESGDVIMEHIRENMAQTEVGKSMLSYWDVY